VRRRFSGRSDFQIIDVKRFIGKRRDDASLVVFERDADETARIAWRDASVGPGWLDREGLAQADLSWKLASRSCRR
jgi:hypothetical protein